MASNLEQDLLGKKVIELKAILRQFGRSTTGTKPILVARIIETNLYTPTVSTRRANARHYPPTYEPISTHGAEIGLRKKILTFILGTFDLYDFKRACDLDLDAEWFKSGSYEEFAQVQEEELAQIELPTLQMLAQLAFLIQSKKITLMESEEMTHDWISDGFILIDGKLIMTHPR